MTNNAPSPGFLLNDAARLMRRRFERLTRDTGLTRAQFQVLAKVAKSEGINQARLADLLDMEPISVCRIIDRMQAAGWIERRSDPKDRRAHLLYMTEAARPALDTMHVVAVDVYADMFAGFSASDHETFLVLLSRVHDNLSLPESHIESSSESSSPSSVQTAGDTTPFANSAAGQPAA